MEMNRKQFLIRAAALAAGVPGVCLGKSSSSDEGRRLVNAGPAGRFAADGLYEGFRDQGFFVIRTGDKLFALSAICTHRRCKLAAERDHSFYCKCHGSTFDPNGKVTEGPATRDLPVLPSFTDENGQLLVVIPAS
jgi:Rieske Fe-S protein